MVNPAHFKLLNHAEHAWNAWRDAQSKVRPDLSGTDLRKCVFRRFNLADTNFSGADLRDANFRRADLRGATLDRAKLYRAFSEACQP